MCKGWQEGDHETREYPGMTRGPLYMDKCLVPILDALNAAGIQTKASCCGHGVRPGVIALADGRELIIAPDYDTARIAEGAFPSVSSSQESGAALVEQIETELAAPFEDGYGREFRYERLLRDALTELRRLRAEVVINKHARALSLLGRSSEQEAREEGLREKLAEAEIRAEQAEARASSPERERALCPTCRGNGVVKIPGGVSVCDACNGDCWAKPEDWRGR